MEDQKKSKWLIIILSSTLGFIAIAAIIVFLVIFLNRNNSKQTNDMFMNSMDNVSNPNTTPKTEDELKSDLETTERANPTKYLSVKFTWKDDFFTTNTIIEGDITNTSSIATFKDMTVEVLFYSKTNTELHKSSFIVYEYSKPGSTVHFKRKLAYNNKTVASISAHVSDAKTE